mmetsp:Transcript_20410/g.31510  ORF Transcript_20410/g.31510 Transcript_20410/m.31510 type:complete len:203 (-) Transcript_20410:63-671(-)|eukprot:CAMPEP_0195300890 /NCGR_PEP_ID=MMETSP0707-20130614/28353_1 /TAXON_ID=33640 /ORGANISM="Asterionellopsis glacialis, Strain CCMP134" /LENGTH=202 /DNA_ID=CAMNT_0040363711 /DNA_START=118 /DNA_END=726 /DNA_ORIENTATION=-
MFMSKGISKTFGWLSTSKKMTTTASSTTRMISIGTDLINSDHIWQKARPWNMDGTSSNMATDNAITMFDMFSKKTVVVFGVPAPFTGTCTNEHYPPYAKLASTFQQEGVDEVVCYSVTDPYSHDGWSKSLQNNDDDIRFVADTEGEWAKEYDLDRDYSASSLGIKSARFSMLVKDGIVKTFHEVEDALQDAETLLDDVKQNK